MTACSSSARHEESKAAPSVDLPVRPGINVIIISFDALRADALDVYGYTPGISPLISRFAEQCVVFERAYTAAPVTPTSFAAAFTGRLPARVFKDWKLTAEHTLAEAFTSAGYLTAAFMNNAQVSSERGFDRGFRDYRYYTSSGDMDVLREVMPWFEENKHQKLFAWIHFINPHSPYAYRKLASQFYDDAYEGPYERTTDNEFETDQPRDIARIRSLYDGEVYFVDFIFGSLVRHLNELGLVEKSVILLTSDHGEEFKERGGFQHGKLFEEHIRIPLLMSHPDVTEMQRNRTLVSNMDFLPTLLHLAGLSLPWAVDGRDLLAPREEPAELISLAMTAPEYRAASIRRDDYKLILDLNPVYAASLFHLPTDPGEIRNMAPDHPDRVRSLTRTIRNSLNKTEWKALIDPALSGDPLKGLTPESVEALKALGYLTE